MEERHTYCPICRKKAAWENNPFRPFCSERCRLIDLGKWASDEYRIPGEKKDLPAEDEGKKNTSEK
ncbi:MAG TPA: DNA gyrase inhibitor YacG [Nitrospirota bacterium]|nr:DNA gyrase inhibitor YacG [Nitrospirota bacterium]